MNNYLKLGPFHICEVIVRKNLETIEIYAQTISHLTSLITSILQNKGVKAVGLSGTSVAEAKRKIIMIKEKGKKKIVRDDYTGKITSIDN